MKMRALVSLFLFGVLSCTGQSNIRLTGTVADCFNGEILHPSDVDIYVFDVSKSAKLLSTLKYLDTAKPNPDDNKSVAGLIARYDQVGQLIKSAKPLVRIKTGINGSFTADLPISTANVLVVAYAESVDGPAIFAYTLAKLDKPSVSGLIVDFARGLCGK